MSLRIHGAYFEWHEFIRFDACVIQFVNANGIEKPLHRNLLIFILKQCFFY